MMKRLKKWWLFTLRNPVARKGENGGFKWVFRRFGMEIGTLSGNFEAKFTAAEHPYGYLVSGKGDDNIEGFCKMLYMVGMLLTTDQGFVDDVTKAIRKYEKRLEKKEIVENEAEEKLDLETEKAIQAKVEQMRKK